MKLTFSNHTTKNHLQFKKIDQNSKEMFVAIPWIHLTNHYWRLSGRLYRPARMRSKLEISQF